MHPRIIPAAAAAVLSCLTAAVGGTALAGNRAPAARRPVAAATITAAAGRVLTLPAAGRVLVSRSPAGPGSVAVLSPGRGPAGLTTLRAGGRDYAIPRAALPYLGRGLDLSLFDVGALERAEQGGRVPVTLHYRGRLRAVPGVTVTSAGAGTAAGYLTARSAAWLGTALRGRPGLSVGLAGIPAAPSVRPGTGTRTGPAARTVRVTVKGTGLSGQPTSWGDVQLSNVATGDTSMKAFAHGIARFSEPPGTYWALAMFYPAGSAARQWLRIDVLPQLKVAGSTVVRMSARAATSKVTLTTPRPARTEFVGLTVMRNAPHVNVGLTCEADGLPLYVSPVTRRPRYGVLRAFTWGQLLSPAGSRVPYSYALDYASPPGTIAPQHFAATSANLATVTERYFQDAPSNAAWWTYGGTRFQVYNSLFGTTATFLRLPARQVQYRSGGPALIWTSRYLEHPLDLAQSGGQADTYRLTRSGDHLTQDWGEYPLHPAGAVNIPGNYYWVVPSAIRQGNVISVGMAPFSDSQPGHQGSGYGIYTLSQNGVVIAHGNTASTNGLVSAQVSSRPSKLLLVLTASRAGARYHLSATTEDRWTWRTRPEPGARIPAPWYCHYFGLSRRCAVQPLITLDYSVAGIGLNGIAPAGPQAITVTARHLQLAPDPAITSARAQASRNGGRTWQPARVRALGHDRFRFTFTTPASAAITLRITVTDTAGNSLAETIIRAYQTRAAG